MLELDLVNWSRDYSLNVLELDVGWEDCSKPAKLKRVISRLYCSGRLEKLEMKRIWRGAATLHELMFMIDRSDDNHASINIYLDCWKGGAATLRGNTSLSWVDVRNISVWWSRSDSAYSMSPAEFH